MPATDRGNLAGIESVTTQSSQFLRACLRSGSLFLPKLTVAQLPLDGPRPIRQRSHRRCSAQLRLSTIARKRCRCCSPRPLRHGEDAGVVGRRAAGGQALVAEICDFAAGRPMAPEISNELMKEIRAEAREAAAILWTRMAEL